MQYIDYNGSAISGFEPAQLELQALLGLLV